MRLEVQCPCCGAMMEPMMATEWSLFGRRAVEVLCPNCTHTEKVYFTTEKGERLLSPGDDTIESRTHG